MLGALFRPKNDDTKNMALQARDLYAAALSQTRQEIFYRDCGVPDTFDGRFDLLLLHLFMILSPMAEKPEYKALSQAVFDTAFKDMDQTLRERGIGDMGVPKHMRRMMMAFNGRMHAYQAAIAPETLQSVKIDGLKQSSLAEALMRNLYATAPEASVLAAQIAAIETYVRESISQLKAEAGNPVRFAALPEVAS